MGSEAAALQGLRYKSLTGVCSEQQCPETTAESPAGKTHLGDTQRNINVLQTFIWNALCDPTSPPQQH